jgi:hypothetical protein
MNLTLCNITMRIGKKLQGAEKKIGDYQQSKSGSPPAVHSFRKNQFVHVVKFNSECDSKRSDLLWNLAIKVPSFLNEARSFEGLET